jgi:dihydrofolate reductase
MALTLLLSKARPPSKSTTTWDAYGCVTIASAKIAQQALDLGLVDEVCVSLVPVLFGEGIPYFTKLDRGHQLLDDPIVIQGRRALHLRYPVRR